MWREKNIYFIEHDIYFTELMFILKNINLELKSALRTKYLFYQSLLYWCKLTTGQHDQVTVGRRGKRPQVTSNVFAYCKINVSTIFPVCLD